MKKLILLISFLVIVSFILLPHKKIETDNKNFNIYIKDGNSYVKQNTSSFPISSYILNTTESTCTGGGTLSQGPDGKISLSMSSAEKCDLYFDPMSGGVIMDLVGDADPTSTDVITKPAPSGANCTNTLAYDGTTDNNLRYVGSNPCNYVTYNGENAGWRIIGLMNNVDNGTGTTQTRIKLIRSSSLGIYSWDSNADWGVNDWTVADLKNELNGDYLDTTLNANTYWYNGNNNNQTEEYYYTQGLSATAQNMIGDAKWPLGGLLDTDSGLITTTMYTSERGTTVWGSTSGQTCNDEACPRSTYWVGKVALPYPSDYGFSTAGGNTTSRSACIGTVSLNMDNSGVTWGNSSYSDCYQNAWIGWGWKLSPISDSGYYAIDGGSGLYYRNATASGSAVLPSVYLKTTVQITGGDGSETNPYTLG